MMELTDKLRTDEATNEDVLAYLQQRCDQITAAGGVAMHIPNFWQFGDLERYRAAAAVWAKDAPPRFALPDLPTLLMAVSGPRGMMMTSFMHNLTALWNQYAAWMQSEGRDPYRPAEDAKAKRARIARESMARTRARRAGTNPLLEESKRAHDLYLTACRQRKQMLEELDANVREAWAAYEAARDAAKG